MMVLATHTLVFALWTILFRHARGIPPREKILIPVNISGQRPTRITATPSVRFFGGTNYAVQHSRRHTHIIGAVTDGGQVVIGGSPLSVSRYVLVVPRTDGSKYIRVITRNRHGNIHSSRVDEFLRAFGQNSYRKLNRTPIEIDLLSQDATQYISVELVTDWKDSERNLEHYRDMEGVPDTLELIPLRYIVHSNMRDDYVIGTVKYGQYKIEDKMEGLLSKEVIWEGGPANPRIMTISRYSNWTEVVTNYRFIGGEFNKFYVRESRRLFLDLRG